jgi:hypothetical protein
MIRPCSRHHEMQTPSFNQYIWFAVFKGMWTKFRRGTGTAACGFSDTVAGALIKKIPAPGPTSRTHLMHRGGARAGQS